MANDNKKLQINPKIFRAYDVRGVCPKEIDEEVAFEIGKAFGSYVGAEMVVGRDARISSKEIFEAFARGVNWVGQDVVNLGVCTTPMLNFAVAHKKFKSGAIITASHNPPEYNGVKLIGEKAVQLSSSGGMAEVKALALGHQAREAQKKGTVRDLDILPEYIDWLSGKIGRFTPIKIVADAGNGIAGLSAAPVFKKFGLEVEELYFEPDGRFPNHQPNPAEEKNLQDVIKRVVESKADLGIVFDGDGDRAFFIDERGKTVQVTFLLAAIACEELRAHPGGKVYYDLRFSKKIVETIRRAGGVPVRTKVGNPFYKERLILQGGLMAAEYSGHFMYKEHYGLDDGLFSVLKVLYWLSKCGKSMSEFVAPYKKNVFISGEINLEVENPAAALQALEQKYSDGKIDRLDGLTVEYPQWWFNLRPSNTEPVVRLNIEAEDAQLLKEKTGEIIKIIKN